MSEPNQSAIEAAHFNSIAPYQEEIKQARAAAKTVLEGFAKEIFVRNISKDYKETWAVEVLMYLQALATLERFVEGKL